jgi:hypothetical protein
MNPISGSHYDEMTLLLFIEQQLEEERAAGVRAHITACEKCRRLHDALEGESALLRSAMREEEEPVPARLLQGPGPDHGIPWGWLLGLGSAGAGAYTLWAGIFEPVVRQAGVAGLGQRNLVATFLFDSVFWKGWESLMDFSQFLALATLGSVAAYFWRRAGSRRTPTAALLLAGLLGLFVSAPVAYAASETRKGDSIKVGESETIRGDFFAFGNDITIAGTVDGDAVLFGRAIEISGHVKGDLIFFGHMAQVSGQVDGDIRAFCNTSTLDAAVGKNVTLFSEDFRLKKKASIGGSLTSFNSRLSLDGRVGRDVFAGFNRGQIDGFIGGELKARGNELVVGPDAELAGSARFRGEKEPTVSEKAKLAGKIAFERLSERREFNAFKFFWSQLISLAGAMAVGIIAVLLIPGLFSDIVKSAQRPGSALGLLIWPGLPVLAVFVCFTLIGIPIGVGALMIWCMAWYAAQVFVGTALGELFLGRAADRKGLFLRMGIGLVAIRAVASIPRFLETPRLTSFLLILCLWILIGAWGMGAMALAIHKRTRPEPVF